MSCRHWRCLRYTTGIFKDIFHNATISMALPKHKAAVFLIIPKQSTESSRTWIIPCIVLSNLKIYISLADGTKDTSSKCFKNVWMLSTRICYKKWRRYLKILMSPLQDVSRLSRGQINNKKHRMFPLIQFSSEIFVHIFPDIRTFPVKQNIPYMNFIIKRGSNTNLNSLFYYYILSNFGNEIVEL